jgi:hypothetical protein
VELQAAATTSSMASSSTRTGCLRSWIIEIPFCSVLPGEGVGPVALASRSCCRRASHLQSA